MSAPPGDPPPPSGLRRGGAPARPREREAVRPTDYALPPPNIGRPARPLARPGNGGSQLRRERSPMGDPPGRTREPVLREVVQQPRPMPIVPQQQPMSPTSPTGVEPQRTRIDIRPDEVEVTISPTAETRQQPAPRPRDQVGRRRVTRRVVEHPLPPVPDPTSPRAMSPPAAISPVQPVPFAPVLAPVPMPSPIPRPSTPPQVNNGSAPPPQSPPAVPSPPYIPQGSTQAWPTSPIPPPPLQQVRPYPFLGDARKAPSYQRIPQQQPASPPRRPTAQPQQGEKGSVKSAPGSQKTNDTKSTGGGIMSLLRGAPKSPPLPPTDTTKTCADRLHHTMQFAEDECNRQQWLERIYSWGINLTILLQLLFAAAITVLSAVPGTYNIATAILGALSTVTAGLLARYRGTNQPDRASAHATALRTFLAECDAFVEDYGTEKGPQYDAKINELRVKLETIEENAEKAEHGVMHSVYGTPGNAGARFAV